MTREEAKNSNKSTCCMMSDELLEKIYDDFDKKLKEVTIYYENLLDEQDKELSELQTELFESTNEVADLMPIKSVK